LRDATNRFGLVLSVLLSASINGFVFAAIHPQGFVAVPALMSLALGMALVREWRGTLIPSMMIHAVHNGLIMGLLMIVLGV
ncbi:MAG: CPBP family intramembrane metalloprotease, partial [Planctomycetota bacterium]|nr:CPBP family intramembrane metalloprotease [Planctomycetota bacterium]